MRFQSDRFAAPDQPTVARASVDKTGRGGPEDECDNRQTEAQRTARLTLRRGKKFFSNPQLGITRKEDLSDKNGVWCQLASCDTFVVLDPFVSINQNSGRLFLESMIVRPLGQDVAAGVT